MPFTIRHLSESLPARTVFVTAFFILGILYHVLVKKSNVFLAKNHIYFFCRNTGGQAAVKIEKLPVDKRSGLWFNDKYPYDKDIDGKLALSGSFREPVAGANRYRTEWAVCLLSRPCERANQ